MLAAVTDGVGSVAVVERRDPAEPGSGQVLLAPEAVGICGSDYHFFLGELSAQAGGEQFPRVLGHEVGARIVAVGPGCRDQLAPGQLIALWPLLACGDCYPCSVGRPNACDNFNLIGIHLDGGLQQRLVVPETQVFPISAQSPAVAALVEPLSIAVQAVRRAAVRADERVVVFGAGPIGQCICLVARDRGAEVLVVDIQATRLQLSAEMGADTLPWASAEDVVRAAREWAGSGGSGAVFDATGAAPAVGAMLEIVASAGRAVQVGMSNQEVPVRIGLLTEKELDLLGVSCCDRDGFAEAVEIAERNEQTLERMVSHRFPLERFPEALRFAIDNPREVLKVVILGE
jgi:threonine dehydrogenase-like Zn-dependent dehydrogenase